MGSGVATMVNTGTTGRPFWRTYKLWIIFLNCWSVRISGILTSILKEFYCIIIVIIVIVYCLLSPLFRVCTTYILGMQCCRYSAVTLYGKCNGISHAECFVLSHQYLLHYVCSAQYGCCLHSLILWFPGMLLRYCLSDFEMVPVAPIVLVSLMILHSTSTVFLLSYLYILESSQLLSTSHSCFLTMWHPLECMFLLHYHGLWHLVSCWGWFFQVSLVDSII